MTEGALNLSVPRGEKNVWDAPRGRFDTGEIAQPLSVTEHTTRHLEQEPPPEPER